MRILLTNDDGVHAPGLVALQRRLSMDHDVTVVAPDRERSAVSHAITLNVPLRVFRVDTGAGPGLSVTGTPADCVKLAVLELMDTLPDMVVSGINPGPNVGRNLNYSGTVSGAREGALLRLPAIAVSVGSPEALHFDSAAGFTAGLIEKVASQGLPPGVFLNVNVPDAPFEDILGVRICRQGGASLEEAFHRREDPRKQPYFWQGSETQLFGDDPGEDGVALRENRISVTPVRCDMTDYDFFKSLETWGLDTP